MLVHFFFFGGGKGEGAIGSFASVSPFFFFWGGVALLLFGFEKGLHMDGPERNKRLSLPMKFRPTKQVNPGFKGSLGNPMVKAGTNNQKHRELGEKSPNAKRSPNTA